VIEKQIWENKMTIEVKEAAEYDNCIGKKDTRYIPKSVLDVLDIEDTCPKDNREWREHWLEMPEFEQERVTFYKKLSVNFETIEDYRKFADLIGQKLTEKTRSIWYPGHPKVKNTVLRWITEE
jgi:hypothetical protein